MEDIEVHSIMSVSSDGGSDEMVNTTKLSIRSLIVQALAISVQDWKVLGTGDDPSVAVSESIHDVSERITGLLLVRIMAVNAKEGMYKDLSTTTICRTALTSDVYTGHVDEVILGQLHTFIERTLRAHRDLPFHNLHHAYAMVISANKLIDMILSAPDSSSRTGLPPTYGLRKEPLAQMAILFAALIRDLNHKGVTNVQLVQEESKYALLYNDNSVHEHRALHLAFRELLKQRYKELREIMFTNAGDYRFFRTLVVNSVLSTDIASPERAQISKSKWKEAFGDSDGLDRQNGLRSSIVSNISMPRVSNARNPTNRRGSNTSMSSVLSDVTTDSFTMIQKQRQVDQFNARHIQMRRLSNQSTDSVYSDFAADSVAQYQSGKGRTRRRMSNHSGDSAEYSDFAADSIALNRKQDVGKNGDSANNSLDSGSAPPARRSSISRAQRRHSQGSFFTKGSSLTYDSIAADSIALAQRGHGLTRERRSQYMDGDERRKHYSEGDEIIVSGEWENNDDDSLSLTPPSSDDEYDGVIITGNTYSYNKDSPSGRKAPLRREVHVTRSFELTTHQRRVTRRASTGNVPVKFGPLTGQRIDEESTSDMKGANGPFVSEVSKFKRRLGIRRSMDLSGEAIQTFIHRGPVLNRDSVDGISSFSEAQDCNGLNEDEPDELKLSVVVEVLVQAALVSHGLQGWENMKQWSSKLFMELFKAHSDGRGHDPCDGWFDNQIRVMESFLVPLSLKLDEMGIFGVFGETFRVIVEENHERWLMDGFALTQELKDSSFRTFTHYFS